ncbi:MarR family transcriptional regulator [Microbacterium sp. 13-71-7]|uniref:MarR family winged helix-turn-helix transcriptional regulator n=1 Tax=Microbacterium sp. 13-71-7 TaxID=1970399 RepID=UPI0025F844BD|nr:MarR family transcriptional regulator [Microbacterium sp. 13-71-7]
MEVPESERRIDRAMIDPRLIDPAVELVRRAHLPDGDVDEIVELMAALHAWHAAAERMSAASRRYMNLNQNDMRAVRFMIAAENAGEVATARALADHLGISSAATTKMLDRLERGGHIIRRPHPADRRAIALQVTPSTRRAAREGVGRLHARRFDVAARMSSDERRTVIRFLEELAATEDGGEAGGLSRRRPAAPG